MMQEFKKKLLQIRNVSLIDDNIAKGLLTYQKHFKLNSKSQDYGHSLSYYIQAARNLWAYYHNNDSDVLFTITTRYPNGRPPFVIVYPTGKDIVTLSDECYNIATDLREISNEKVIIKKLSLEYSDIFKKKGFSEYSQSDGWNSSYKLDDDEFPEFLVNLSHYFDNSNTLEEIPIPMAKKTANIRGYARRFAKWLTKENCRMSMSRYNHEADYGDVRSMIHTWAKFRRIRHPEEEHSELVDSHICFLLGLEKYNLQHPELIDRFANSYVFRINHVESNESKVIGFGYVDQISSNTVGIYAELALHQQSNFDKSTLDSVTDTGIPGCSEVLTLLMLKDALDRGFSFANFGGSESENLYKSRRYKFHNFQKNSMTHLVLY